VEHRHALAVANLPPHHRDPFDRILVAQAIVESLPLLTAEPQLTRYGIEAIAV
jgi:PIN domain nuclease of toxin-antitoxin system